MMLQVSTGGIAPAEELSPIQGQDPDSIVVRNAFPLRIPPADGPAATSILRSKPATGEHTAEQLDFLIGAARNGDLEAFRALYDTYAGKILNFIYRMTRSRQEAEDLTQETFILAYRNLGKLRENSRFQNWLYRIAQNLAIQKYRTRPPRMESIEEVDEDSWVLNMHSSVKTPEGTALSEELKNVIRTAINELPERRKRVFLLSAIDKWSYEAIAQTVGRSLPSVKSDIHRARVEVTYKIRKYIGRHRKAM
jgi:RNA polymerase sigma-70 factor (ECF subfamily)